jgi:hypothetical protein
MLETFLTQAIMAAALFLLEDGKPGGLYEGNVCLEIGYNHLTSMMT